MKILIAALLSAVMIWLAPANTQINKQVGKAPRVHKHTQEQVIITPQTEQKAELVAITPQPTVNLDDHEQLMSLAGISQSDWPAADYIVSHESSWNPLATEPNSGAHGLPQALPYSKTGCGWEDAVCQLQWANNYAIARYGGWWAAYSYWVNHRNW